MCERNDKKPPLLILTGPTSVGKSALSIALAKAVGGEIISADSMQVYRYMDIGSAKITEEQMQGVFHHMIDILDPSESFNLNLFQKKAKEYIREIYDRGHIPHLHIAILGYGASDVGAAEQTVLLAWNLKGELAFLHFLGGGARIDNIDLTLKSGAELEISLSGELGVNRKSV